MRQGANPYKVAHTRTQFQRIVLACVTHLPDTHIPYHARRMEVVQTCLTTMRAGAKMSHTMIVWDNGSGPELRNWLQNEFKPDVLILSENLGKTSARSALTRMCHPKSIIAYSDDDILFYDNWLTPQIELLEHFPNVACVTGYPVRTAFRWGCENTIHWAEEHAKLEKGKFIPREWENDFALSLGREPKWHEEYSAKDTDYRVTYNGKQAYCTSHHCQFVAHVETIEKVLQYDNWAMADEKPFDLALDSIGLRLATTERYTRHIGNVLDEKIKAEIEVMYENSKA